MVEGSRISIGPPLPLVSGTSPLELEKLACGGEAVN
jgi:hypothetical protein